MKILTIFIDMIRTDFLSSFNSEVKKTSIDTYLEELKGTLFTNCFTNGPDTARSMSTFWTGLPCYRNGCNKRAQYPNYFLEYTSFLQSMANNNYDINLFTNVKKRNVGIYPPGFLSTGNHNSSFDLVEFLKNIDISHNDLFVFIDIDDYHWAIDDYGANYLGVVKAQKETNETLAIISENLDFNEFDEIIIFSDHGHLIYGEYGKKIFENILHPIRSRVLMFWHHKEDVSFMTNNKLASIADFYPTILDICNISYDKAPIDGINFFSAIEHKYICMEDSFSFKPAINMDTDIWGIITHDSFYCTTLSVDKLFWGVGATALREIIEQECPEFIRYLKEHEILQYYTTLKDDTYRDKYTNGNNRLTLTGNHLIKRAIQRLISIFYKNRKSIIFEVSCNDN